MDKVFDKNGKELFTYKIEFCWTPKLIEYLAESEEEARSLFLENNQDLEDVDLYVIKVKDYNNVKEVNNG